MNNSITSPHFPQLSSPHVENRVVPSTGCESSTPPLTRGFAEYSTIHNPYYHYLIYFNYRAVRREGTICAYPS